MKIKRFTSEGIIPETGTDIKKMLGTKLKYHPLEYDLKHQDPESKHPVPKGPHMRKDDHPNLPLAQAIADQTPVDVGRFHPDQSWSPTPTKKVKETLSFTELLERKRNDLEWDIDYDHIGDILKEHGWDKIQDPDYAEFEASEYIKYPTDDEDYGEQMNKFMFAKQTGALEVQEHLRSFTDYFPQ